MNPIDQTPLSTRSSIDLADELSVRLRERQVLGVRIRVALLAAELDRRRHGEAA